MSDDDNGDNQPTRPVLRVVKGDATAEEIAVLTALVAASGSGDDGPASRERRGAWNDPAWLLRKQLYPGPNGWNGSLR